MKYTGHSYRPLKRGLQSCGWMASWAVLLLATPSLALALTNSDIVDATSPSSVYMRKGFELSDGSIKELVSHKTGVSLYYCNPVSVRSAPDISSRKVTSINDGNFGDFTIRVSSTFGWADVHRAGEHIGYSAQAIKKGSTIENIICAQPRLLAKSSLQIGGVAFEVDLVDQRNLTVKGQDGEVIYTRRVSDQTSLYELRNSSGLFGWLVGWDLYDDTQYFGDIDFTVARVIVPYVDSQGDQKVWDAVYPGVQNSKYLSMLKVKSKGVSIVAGMGIRGPRFYSCNGCAWHWGQPIFVTIERTSNGIEERIDNGALNFRNVKDLSHADQFLYNWLYWNPSRLTELLHGQVGQQIETIITQCTLNKLAFYKRYFIPQWEWLSPLHYLLYKRSKSGVVINDQAKNYLPATEYALYYEDGDASYGTLLDYLWGPEANGYDYFNSLMGCVEDSPEDRGLVRNIVGYLNLPLDADLLEAVIGERK